MPSFPGFVLRFADCWDRPGYWRAVGFCGVCRRKQLYRTARLCGKNGLLHVIHGGLALRMDRPLHLFTDAEHQCQLSFDSSRWRFA
jgi:hypothetical protein